MRDLLVRGMRYTLAAVVPLALVVILAEPILDVWLGDRFTAAGTAMAILASHWLLNGSMGVPGENAGHRGSGAGGRGLCIRGGCSQRRDLYSALQPRHRRVVLGTTIAYVVAFPVFVWIVVSAFPVRLTEIAREVWLPAYATGVPVAVALLLARISLPLDTVPAVLGAAALALLAYWGAYYFTWLRPGERALIKAVGAPQSAVGIYLPTWASEVTPARVRRAVAHRSGFSAAARG